MTQNIEVEVRAFITDDQYRMLVDMLRSSCKEHEEDDQVTYYFTGPSELRIQQNKRYSKVWLKKDKIHDDAREEIEVRVPREDFGKLENLFKALGFEVEIKWFRRRHEFAWDGMKVTLDFTKGYGYILELEKTVTVESEVEKAKQELTEKMLTLGIDPTPKEIFERAYAWYRENWRSVVGEDGSS